MKAQYRFFTVNQIPPEEIGNREPSTARLSEDDFRKIANVLRLTAGDTIELICPISEKSFLAQISLINKSSKELQFKITSETTRVRTQTISSIYLGLCKSEKNDWLCQKATELGTENIYFVNCARSVSKIPKIKAAEKILRWQKIAKAAAQQSMQSSIPTIAVLDSLEDCLEAALSLGEESFFCHPEGQSILDLNFTQEKKNLIIGPEGGFSAEELELLSQHARKISLGNTILRSETAAILALGIFNLKIQQK